MIFEVGKIMHATEAIQTVRITKPVLVVVCECT